MSKWTLVGLLAAFVFVADQVTKYLAVARLTNLFRAVDAKTLGERIAAFATQRDLVERGLAKYSFYQVVPSFWQHRYTQNRAAAFGMLGFVPESMRVGLFYVITIAAVIFILTYVRKLEPSQRYLQVALALVLGGALGNGLDRILHGYVIDFIDWHLNDPEWMKPSVHWPTFNVADSGISVGLALLFLEMLFDRKAAGKPAAGRQASVKKA